MRRLVFAVLASLLVSSSMADAQTIRVGDLRCEYVKDFFAAEREASPAVVNPAVSSPLRKTMSLDGEWDFALDARHQGDEQKWFLTEPGWPAQGIACQSIRVPGEWASQGIGGPGKSTAATFEQSIRPLRGAYVGTGWYRKEIGIPKEWAGKQIWLKIGGVHAQGWFWINGERLGHNDCYCGTYKYNVTGLMRPGGKAVVVAKVRNDVAGGKGLMGWIHRFGGLYRSVEIEATPDVLVDNAFVEGDLDEHAAEACVRLRSMRAKETPPAEGTVEVAVNTLDGVPAGSGRARFSLAAGETREVRLEVPLEPLRPWSPERPSLYRADVVLSLGGQKIDGWAERFGVRKWEVRGGSFYLNNRKYLIRGFGDDYVYPLTLCSPASREFHRRHLQLAKDYGFVYVRHHTHCEVPEFYETADEAGILVQPEMPYYGRRPSDGNAAFRPREDLRELIEHYRRYVSLATYCTGNEGHMGSPIDFELYRAAKELDPTRLFLHQDGGKNTPQNSHFSSGPTTPWAPGSVRNDRPFTAHEYLNLATDEDPRLAGKYTGALGPPVTGEAFRRELAQAGLSWEWGTATLDAGNQLQRIFQKRGLESARLDPACGGYIYWTIVDVGSPAAQGLFNQFWEPKASTVGFFRGFNGPTAVLVKRSPAAPVLAEGDEVKLQWWISAFDDALAEARPLDWKLVAGSEVLAQGRIEGLTAAPGDVKAIGESKFAVPAVPVPAHARLIAGFSGTDVRNSWDCAKKLGKGG